MIVLQGFTLSAPVTNPGTIQAGGTVDQGTLALNDFENICMLNYLN